MKTYWLLFGDGNPALNTGLSPTMTLFAGINGTTLLSAPGITEIPAGSGWYRFFYGPTFSINFVVDGGAGLANADRYIRGVLDPLQIIDERMGSDDASFGSTSADPTSIYGFVKRNLEVQEGNKIFNKATGTWDVYSRGSSTLLFEKDLTNTTTQATST